MSSLFVVGLDKRPTLEQLHRLAAENAQLLRLMSEYGGGGQGNPNDVLKIQQRLHGNLVFLAEASKPEHWKDVTTSKAGVNSNSKSKNPDSEKDNYS